MTKTASRSTTFPVGRERRLRGSIALGLLGVAALLVVGCSSDTTDGEDGVTSEDQASNELRRRKRDAGAPSADGAAAPSLYGFIDGATMIGRGLGTTTRNEGPSYQCKRRTRRDLPCGGWVRVTAEAGRTVVTLHTGSHSEWNSEVAGHGYLADMTQVPPPWHSTFWTPSATLTLDATGRAERHDVRRDPVSFAVVGTTDYALQAEDGAISVSFQRDGDSRSCNRVDDTCSFRVTAR